MIPLRLVLDTNIVVSAALKQDSLPRTVLLIATSKPAHLYISREILDEYRDVLSRRELAIRKPLRQQLIALIEDRARRVRPTVSIRAAWDSEDDKFLECANAARSDYLVTGNLKHFPRFWKQTKIIAPREFLELAAPHLLT